VKTKVAITRCRDYDVHRIKDSLYELIELLGGWSTFFPKGSKILLKPNLLSARKAEKGITTHPNVVYAVAESLLEYGVNVAFGDSPAGAHKGVKRVHVNTGMEEVSQKLSIPLVNFEKSGAHQFESNGFDLKIARVLDEFDYIINLPRLKTHSLMLYTGALKNMYGIVPGFQKTEYHKLYPKPKDFGRLLVEIYNSRKPVLNIMDAITGMEGDGPSSGELRYDVGLLIVSSDAVALDAVAETIIGMKKQSPTTHIAESNHIGENNLHNIEVIPDKIEEYILTTPFKLPLTKSKMADYVPAFLTKPLAKLIWIRPALDAELCIKCSKCLQMCPVNAITMDNHNSGKPVFDYKKCVLCLCCHEICPEKAIVLERSRLAKLF